jgi:DNA (cytosine-5)-methyltransferase 1
LSQCWTKAIAPRAADARTVISTFAGSGGSSLGYAIAGFKEELVVEWDDDAVRVFRENFVKGPIGGDERPHVFHGDIAKLSVEKMLEITGLEPGELDVFDGSPPCQGFSTAGQRVVEDARNQLFMEFSRLIVGSQPKVFVMENVKGMVMGTMKPSFVNILEHLRGLGYRVSAKLIIASWLGVPQRRPRMVFIGTRNDLNINPDTLYPKPWAFEPTTQDAIKDLQGNPQLFGPHMAPHGKTKDLLEVLPQGRSGQYVTGNAGFGLSRARWTQPSFTICKTHNPRMYAGIVHPLENRYFGINELKRIGSFPDLFQFGCEFPDWWDGRPLVKDDDSAHRKQITEVWARIGNSVPPLMMAEIASSIKRGLDKAGV